MITNQMKLTFDLERIRQDFTLYSIAHEGKHDFKSPIPDMILQIGQALSVLYERSCCYALFRSDSPQNQNSELKHLLEQHNKGLRIQKIDPRDLYHNQLAQLLFNALPILGNQRSQYCNLCGKLYYPLTAHQRRSRGTLNSFSVLNFSITGQKCITMNLKTFSNASLFKANSGEPQYLFDSRSGALRRVLDSDKSTPGVRYIQKSLSPNTKNTLPFLAFDSSTHFRESKIGILHRFLKDVKTFLFPYLELTPLPIQESTHYIPEMHESLPAIRRLLAGIPIYLQDTVNSPESAQLKALLEYELDKYSELKISAGHPQPGSILFRIIHNPMYYINCNQPDPHYSEQSDYIIQHLTVEDFPLYGTQQGSSQKESPALKKVIQELAIKQDILCKTMSVFDWQQLKFTEPLTFAIAERSDSKSPCIYKRLTIDPDGQLHFDAWKQDSGIPDAFQDRIEAAFLTQNGKFDRSIEGLICFSSGPIHIIRSTDKITLPPMNELELILKKTVNEELLAVSPILETARRLYPSAEAKNQTNFAKAITSLEALGKLATRHQIKKAVNLRTNAGNMINCAYYTETGILIGNDIKQQEKMEQYFGAMLDIRWYQQDNAVYCFSGYRSKGLNSQFPHACRIREITAEDGSNCGALVEKLLPLLAIDFVRTSGWTVLPFPFKYLREWQPKL